MQRNGWSNTLSQWTSCGNKWNYRNKNLVAIYDIYCNDIFCCKNLLPQSLLQRLKPITTEFIATAKTYYHRVYCNGLQQLIFVAIKVYCNKMKVIATKNFVAINLFSCSACSSRYGRNKWPFGRIQILWKFALCMCHK